MQPDAMDALFRSFLDFFKSKPEAEIAKSLDRFKLNEDLEGVVEQPSVAEGEAARCVVRSSPPLFPGSWPYVQFS